MIYFNHYNTYYELFEQKSLSQLAEENNTKLIRNDNLDKETRDWFNYAHIISVKNNFNVIYEACFIYYVTKYFAEEGISAGAEDEYFLKKLDKKIYELYYIATLSQMSEEKQKKSLFDLIVNFFKSDEITSYEKKVFQHNIRVTPEIKDWVTKFPTMREAILQLLYNKTEKPHLSIYSGETTSNLVFMLTYSEETKWRALSPIGDVDRLRILLF